MHWFVIVCLSIVTCVVGADEQVIVPIHQVIKDQPKILLGTITVTKSEAGLVFTPNLSGFNPQQPRRGFHIHQQPSCANVAQAAGGHLDPALRKQHQGPYASSGHLGDLPMLTVNADGSITLPVIAPRITQLQTINHHSLVIHAQADNYADNPQPVGGSGARVACGIIEFSNPHAN